MSPVQFRPQPPLFNNPGIRADSRAVSNQHLRTHLEMRGELADVRHSQVALAPQDHRPPRRYRANERAVTRASVLDCASLWRFWAGQASRNLPHTMPRCARRQRPQPAAPATPAVLAGPGGTALSPRLLRRTTATRPGSQRVGRRVRRNVSKLCPQRHGCGRRPPALRDCRRIVHGTRKFSAWLSAESSVILRPAIRPKSEIRSPLCLSAAKVCPRSPP